MSVLVGRKAPDFTAPAVLGDGTITGEFRFLDTIKGKTAALFFYPLDFTFVCPTELIAFDKRLAAFQKRGVEVIGVSVDSHFVHNAWRNTPINQGGIGQVRYPLVADITHKIVRDYGVETPNGVAAYRATFLIDNEGTVRHQVINDLGLGRNIDELLRMIDALHFTQKYGEVCPAGWKEGDTGMKGSIEGVAKYLSEHADEL